MYKPLDKMRILAGIIISPICKIAEIIAETEEKIAEYTVKLSRS